MTTSPSSESFTKLDGALRIVSTLGSLIPRLESLRQALLQNFGYPEASLLLQRFVLQESPSIDHLQGHAVADFCPSAYIKTMTQLHQRLTVLILNIGLRTSPCNEEFGTVLTKLIDKQTKLSNSQFKCTESVVSRRLPEKPALSLFETGSTPGTQTISHNWRETLVRDLSRDAHHQYESVTRLVGEICRDLELRCEDAERPFREEQCKYRELTAKLEDSHFKIAELEAQTQSQSSELREVGNEKDNLSERLNCSEQRLQDLRKKFDKVHEDFEQAKDRNEHAAQVALERSRQQDLDYMTVLAGKDLMLEEQAAAMSATEERMKGFESELTQYKSRALEDARTIECKESLIQDSRSEVAFLKELAAAKQIDIDRLTAGEAELTEGNKRLVRDAHEKASHHEMLISDLNAQLETEIDRSGKLQHQHEQFASAKHAEIRTLEDLHKSSIASLRAGLDEARKSAAATHEEGLSQIAALRKQMKQMRKEREEQAEEVIEARKMKNQFMNLMGNINYQPVALGKKSRASAHVVDTVRLEEHAFDSAPSTSFQSSFSGTSSRSGPTPKRTKRHRASPKISSSDAHESQCNVKNHLHSGATPRTPLKDLNKMPNSSQLTPTPRLEWEKPMQNQDVGDKVMRENDEVQGWRSDDESFDGGNIFTSTDQQQLSALRSRTLQMPKNSLDETTTEF